MMDNGEILPCCPPWIGHYSFGNIKDPFETVWNGSRAQAFRRSILDGSFRYCNPKSCPHMQTKSLTVHSWDNIHDAPINNRTREDLTRGKIVLDHGAFEVQCCYDRSCNLSCPSCRREVIVVSGQRRQELLSFQSKFIADFWKDCKLLFITGSGDAFGSPIFRNLLQSLSREHAPDIQYLCLLTNGLLVKRYWNTLSPFAAGLTKGVSVSIDAATENTYRVNRRPADWYDLIENLQLLKEKRRQGEIARLGFSFVVQQNNYREMSDFVKMAEDFGADSVQFQIIEPDFIRDLKHDELYFQEWIAKAVHEEIHSGAWSPAERASGSRHEKASTRIEVSFGPLTRLKEGRGVLDGTLLKKKRPII